MTIFPLALRLAPQNTKNIIRTREKKDKKDFFHKHSQRHTLTYGGGKRATLCIFCFFTGFPRRCRSCFAGHSQQKRSSAVPTSFFDQLKKIAKYFFVFPFGNANQPAKLFLLPSCVPRPVPPHSHTHAQTPQPRGSGGFCSLAVLFVGKFGRLRDLRPTRCTLYNPEPFLHPPEIVHNSPHGLGRDLPELGAHTCNRRHRLGVVVGSSARVTQSDVCDVTFPKTDSMLVALLQGSRVLTFFGGPLLLYPYRTGDDDDDEDISELPAESVVSFLLFFSSLCPISQ